ncbi:2'-5' RNA ligase family protein [Sphingomonas crusticola]|uniref:2'-5' RNA ligase family protein n=1 Tax=Sphingomonas crusticola TaxID=1697973 RepID=UPI000E26976A|nr:2'-5' RNA ligase family protein [Sphingomonas crusticola]
MPRSASSPQLAVHNLFFAIQPPKDIRLRLAKATALLPVGGKPVGADRLHISTLNLVHEGALPEGLREEAAEAVTDMEASPFPVMFDRLAGGATSIVLLPGEPLDHLRLFRERLGLRLIRAGMDVRLERRFRPHITLLYGNELTFETEIDPIVWTVEDFVLIDSFVGQTKHVEVGRWPLRA